MKRSGEGELGQGGKRMRNVANPYLQTSSSARRQHDEVFSKRNRRGDRALIFQQEEEVFVPPPLPAPIVPPLPSETEVPKPAAKRVTRQRDVPKMEWWDAAFLPKDKPLASWEGAGEEEIYSALSTGNQKTFTYVEHPVTIAPNKQTLEGDEPLKLYQTRRELKRIRRQNRAALTQEKRDKIAIGLIPPPRAKVKISNLLRVLAADHAADPTQIEARVREEMEQRKMQHDARNLAQKLTPRERVDKLKRRIARDAEQSGNNVVVLSVLGHGLWGEVEETGELAKKRLSKLLLTARKLMLTGRFLIVTAPQTLPGVIIAEGGQRSLRKFIRLVTVRLDWKSKTLMEAEMNKVKRAAAAGAEEEEDSESDDSEDGEGEEPAEKDACCQLLWRGVLSKREFEGFAVEKFESGLDAKSFLVGKNLGHFWDLATNNI